MIKHLRILSVLLQLLATELKAWKVLTFSTSVNSGERFCATTRMRRSFELQENKNIIIIEYEQATWQHQ